MRWVLSVLAVAIVTTALGISIIPHRRAAFRSAAGAPSPDILWFKFDENTGTTLADSVGTNTATINSDSMWTTGVNGSALAGNGSSYDVQTDGVVVYGTNIITVSCWMWDAVYTADQDFLESSVTQNNNDGAFSIFAKAGSKISATIQDSVSSSRYRQEWSEALSTSTWINLVIVYDNSTTGGDITIYVDGVLQAEDITIDTKNQSQNFVSYNLYLLARGASSLFSDAKIDDLRIYSGELSQDDIDAIYAEYAP